MFVLFLVKLLISELKLCHKVLSASVKELGPYLRSRSCQLFILRILQGPLP